MRVRFTVIAIRVSHTGPPPVPGMGYVLALHADRRTEGDRGGRAPGGARARGGRQAEGERARRRRAERRRRGRAADRRCVHRGGGDRSAPNAADVWGSDVVVTIAPPDPEQIRSLGSGSILVGFLAPLTSPVDHARAGRQRRDRVRDGGDPAHLACPVDGRAVLAEQRRRLPRRAARAPRRWVASTRC